MCGFVENQEYSTRDIGRSVLKTNHALRNKTFSQLLSGRPLPDKFRENVNQNVDNMDERGVGCWALSDLRNQSFVQFCRKWTSKEVVRDTLFQRWRNGA